MRYFFGLTLLICVCLLSATGQTPADFSVHMKVNPSFGNTVEMIIEYDGRICSVNGNPHLLDSTDNLLRSHLNSLRVTAEKLIVEGNLKMSNRVWGDGTATKIDVLKDGKTVHTGFHSGNSNDDPLINEIVSAAYNVVYDMIADHSTSLKPSDGELYDLEYSECHVIRSPIRKVSDQPLRYRWYGWVNSPETEEVLKVFNSFPENETVTIEVGRFVQFYRKGEFARIFSKELSKKPNIRWIVCEENKGMLLGYGIPKKNIIATNRKLEPEVTRDMILYSPFSSGQQFHSEQLKRMSRH
ncbi:MAG: hypothetical protein GC178_01195 [Flavobacteriales bacterium]|nr:hypothetical protein [Flavobacteriales bacterium]